MIYLSNGEPVVIQEQHQINKGTRLIASIIRLPKNNPANSKPVKRAINLVECVVSIIFISPRRELYRCWNTFYDFFNHFIRSKPLK